MKTKTSVKTYSVTETQHKSMVRQTHLGYTTPKERKFVTEECAYNTKSAPVLLWQSRSLTCSEGTACGSTGRKRSVSDYEAHSLQFQHGKS